MPRMRVEQEWVVTRIMRLDENSSKPWKVWWDVGGCSLAYEDDVAGVSAAFRSYAALHPLTIIHLNISHLRRTNRSLEARFNNKPGWIAIQDIEVLPEELRAFQEAHEEQRRSSNGVTLTKSSRKSLGCCAFAVVNLMPELRFFKRVFLRFRHGSEPGRFVNWLKMQYFGAKKVLTRRVRVGNQHPFHFFTDNCRQNDEMFLVLVRPDHMVGIHCLRGRIWMHCTQQDSKTVLLTWKTWSIAGGRLGYRGPMWKVELEDRF